MAFYNEVAARKGKISSAPSRSTSSGYANQLFQSIQPIKVHSREEAIAKVKSGEALAAVIVPGDIASQIQSLVTNGVGNPTVELILNTKDPLERQFVDQAIQSRLNQVQQAISRQVLRVAISDLRQVLNGGTINFAGPELPAARPAQLAHDRPGRDRRRCRRSRRCAALQQVVAFADLAIQGLGVASPVLGSIGTPLTVEQTELAGRTTPTDTYAVAIAVVLSLDALDDAAGRGHARDRALREHLLEARPRPGLAGAATVREGRAVGAVRRCRDAADGGFVSMFVHLDWGAVRAVDAGAGVRRARVRRARSDDRRRSPGRSARRR